MNNEFYCVSNQMMWKIKINNEFEIKQCKNYISQASCIHLQVVFLISRVRKNVNNFWQKSGINVSQNVIEKSYLNIKMLKC